MVTIGMRHGRPAVLDELQASVLRDAEGGPVDRGAALCGRAYAALARPMSTAAEAMELEQAILEHVAGAPGGPHQLRWHISLLFVGGELARRRGDFAAARSMYERCAQLDPVPYSPLLGNKTLDAWFRLAMLAVGEHDLLRARQCFVRCVDEARRLCTGSWLNVCGDPAKPLAFGFAELAQLLDKAGRAAYALAVLDSAVDRPAVFAAEAKGYFERILGCKDDGLAAATRENRQLYEELARSNRHAEQLAAIGDEKERHIRELAAALAARPAGVVAAVRALLGRLADRLWRTLAPGRGRRP
jgi:tetratricopeptide (TPR) repeat protein